MGDTAALWVTARGYLVGAALGASCAESAQDAAKRAKADSV